MIWSIVAFRLLIPILPESPSSVSNVIAANSNKPVRGLTVTITAQGPDKFESKQILRTGASSRVEVPITSHLKHGFKVAISAKGHQTRKLTWEAALTPTKDRTMTIRMHLAYNGRRQP